jgi:phosphoserine phosphatase RsbU/P
MPRHLPHAILVVANSVSITEWRWAVFAVGIVGILLASGLLAIGIFIFRKQTRDHTPLYFGIFVILYAVRVFLHEPALRFVFAISPTVAAHIIRTITFIITLPTLFLFLEVVPTRWRRPFLWALGVQLVFASLAIPLDFFGIARRTIDISNSVLVLGSWIPLSALLFFLRPPGRLPREFRVVAVGFAVLALFILHANLVNIQLIHGRDVEAVGFLFFVCTLAYLVAHRIFAREESLFAIQKELEIAEQIQTSILPRDVPHFAGIEIAARCRPMSAVAGDFYDFLTPDGNQLGILIADVTGHGIPAALIASMLKVALAGQTGQAQDPALVLSGLNQALCGKFEEHFVTAAYLLIDIDRHILRYAGAGHPPLLFSSRSNGEVRTIEHNGLILGMFPEAAYSSIEITLQSGDRYVLYTDGLIESTNAAGEEYAIARCTQFLRSHSRLPAAVFADELLSEIARWSDRSSGRAQEDDMTLLVIDCQR